MPLYDPNYLTASINTVDLGFGFPVDGVRVASIRVMPNGIIQFNTPAKWVATLKVLESDETRPDAPPLAKLTEAYKHVYVARGEGMFTVRWGTFAMVTLYEDGHFVVAYGPDADGLRKVGDSLCATRMTTLGGNDSVFAVRSGLYAGINDAVFTPTGIVGPTGLSADNKLYCTLNEPGTYTAKVRYTASDENSVTNETFTKTFIWTVTGEKKAVPKILSVSYTGVADEYGIYHVADGETAPTFTATASEGATIKWSDGAYSKTGSIVPTEPTSAHTLLPVTLKVSQNDYTATRVFYVAFNKVFHVDASTAVAAKDQDGSSEKPWNDFYFKVAREDGTTVMMREDARYLPGDTIVVHPGTYHHPIRIMDFDGGLTIVNSEGGSAANTSLEIEREANDVYWPVTGRRAFTHAPWGLTLTTNGWQYVRVPSTNTFVRGLAIRNSSIMADRDLDVSVQGVAGGGAFGGTFLNCVFEDCVATNRGPLQAYSGYYDWEDGYGGAAYGANLINCAIVGCLADIGGAAANCRLVNCTITGCRAYGRGGGSYRATLVRCRVEGNDCFQDGNKDTCYGGGAYGGSLTDCRITGNDVGSWYGSATYDAVLKNSFVWGNGSNYCTQEIVDGDHGASLYVTKKVPTAARVAAQPTILQEPGEETRVFNTKEEAQALAAVTAVDVPSEIVANRIDVEEYVERFEVKTVENPDGEGFINEVTLKPAEVEKVETQVEEVLTVDDDGNARTDYTVQKMEKTLTETTQGLYYALEFSTDLSGDSFKGDRHLATGKGSVKISATSTDSPSGFWRVNVYTTPDGD